MDQSSHTLYEAFEGAYIQQYPISEELSARLNWQRRHLYERHSIVCTAFSTGVYGLGSISHSHRGKHLNSCK